MLYTAFAKTDLVTKSRVALYELKVLINVLTTNTLHFQLTKYIMTIISLKECCYVPTQDWYRAGAASIGSVQARCWYITTCCFGLCH